MSERVRANIQVVIGPDNTPLDEFIERVNWLNGELRKERDEARRLFDEAMEWGESAEVDSEWDTEGGVTIIGVEYTKPRPVATWKGGGSR